MDQECIRRARLDDLPTLVEFNRAMAWETEGLQLEPERLRAGVDAVLREPAHGFYLVAEQDAAVIGAMMVTFEWSDWRNGLFWWIQSVYVRPDQRRRGVFRRLYRAVGELAANDPNVCGFRLYVERDNRAAQQTYAALGMRPTHYVLFEQLKPRD